SSDLCRAHPDRGAREGRARMPADAYRGIIRIAGTVTGVVARLVAAPVFKTGRRAVRPFAVGSIPIYSRQSMTLRRKRRPHRRFGAFSRCHAAATWPEAARSNGSNPLFTQLWGPATVSWNGH